MGVEISGKTLGVIGCGNIGSIVADRAIGLKMKVIAYDPFLSEERARDLGVEKVELDELFKRADFITLHTPLTDKTRNIIDAAAIKKMKKGVRIINCARGGLVDEAALAEALKSGQVAGAAFDVFVEEPATSNPLFGLPNVVCTPHLGAATSEAQENVALQVAEQMSDYLLRGAISNAVNFPSISAEEAPKLQAVHRARREARLLRRPVDRNRPEQGADLLRGRGGADEHQGADLGGARRPAAADAAGRQRGLGAGGGQGARHHGRGDHARDGRRLRKPDHGDGGDRRRRRARCPAPCSPTAARASSTSRASAWTPSSGPR